MGQDYRSLLNDKNKKKYGYNNSEKIENIARGFYGFK